MEEESCLDKKINIKREGASEETVGFLEKKIRHIVVSGGGVAGFSFYGTLREASKQGLWHISDIKTLYGTSIGAVMTTIIALKYDWDILDDFLIKRPWQNIYHFDMHQIFLTFQNKGIFNKDVIKNSFLPLFKGKDISMDVTLKEFYDITNIELHYFATNVNKFEEIDFSYKTHPDWKVIDAIYASCALPLLLQPLITDDGCYSDGGIFSNYPVAHCIKNGADPEEIFGINRCSVLQLDTLNITENSSIIDYVFNIVNKIVERVLNNRKETIKIRKEIVIKAPTMSLYNIYLAASTVDERIRLIQRGVDAFLLEK
jgi:NTE family protein